MFETVWGTLRETVAAWRRDKGSQLAAALAYYTIFSIAPLLIIMIAITGLVFGERAARDEIAYQIADLVGAEAAEIIQTMLANFENPASGILTSLFGLGTMLYGATGLFNHVQGALNTIWQIPVPAGNGLVYHLRKRAVHLALVAGVGAMLLLTLFAEIVVATLAGYFRLQNPPEMRGFAISWLTAAVLFAVVYKILPEVRVAWRDVLIAAAVTSLLFNAGKSLIAWYIRWSHVGSDFGAAGSLVVLLVWVYYSAQIFLLGAEFAHVYAQRHGSMRLSTTAAFGEAVPVPLADAGVPEAETAESDDPDTVDIVLPDGSHHVVTATPVSVTPRKKRYALSRKALALSSILGTLIASALGANWLHRKRSRKQS